MVGMEEIRRILEEDDNDDFLKVINGLIKPYRIINVERKSKDLVGLFSGEIVIEKKPSENVGVREEFNAFEKIVVGYWNEFVKTHPNLTAISKMSDERRKKLKVRFVSRHFQENICEAIDKISKSPFLLGSKGWKISFDYLLANDTNYLKVLEGKFEDRDVGIHKFIK